MKSKSLFFILTISALSATFSFAMEHKYADGFAELLNQKGLGKLEPALTDLGYSTLADFAEKEDPTDRLISAGVSLDDIERLYGAIEQYTGSYHPWVFNKLDVVNFLLESGLYRHAEELHKSGVVSLRLISVMDENAFLSIGFTTFSARVAMRAIGQIQGR